MPLRLVAKNLFAHRLRALLTIASFAVAIFLLCVLRALVVSLDAGVRNATSNRLVVQSAVSLFVSLPESYLGKLHQVDGVEEVARVQWFGGFYQEPGNFFGQFGVDPDQFLRIFPEIRLVPDSPADALERFHSERRACLVGRKTAEKFGFKVGDTIPIIGTIFQRTDGEPWEFEVVGIYELESMVWDETTLFFPFEYLSETLDAGAATGPKGSGIFYLQLDGSIPPVSVAAATDALFENGPQRVQTTSEAEFNAQFVSMIGNVPFFVTTIGGGVLAAIVLAVLNTMLLSGREQTHTIGVLKALGFSDGTVFGVMLGQAMLLTLVGGGAGIALAIASGPGFQAFLGTMFPGYEITDGILGQAALLSVAVGLAAGLLPAWRARSMQAVEALRRVH
ncbi:MAG: ABC transporter permease [Planctomycetes bacterium]|nr:ABC transporter permease [Planctomycetota bacterium]